MDEESLEYVTLVRCTKQLEIALKDKRDIVHFLECNKFISRDVHEETLDPKSSLNIVDKSGRLVERIKDKIQLNPQNYYLFLNELKSNSHTYGDIIEILDSEFQKQQLKKPLQDGNTI